MSWNSHHYKPIRQLAETSFYTGHRRKLKILGSVFALFAFFTVLKSFHPSKTGLKYGNYDPTTRDDPIPKIVHFVYIRSDPGSQLKFSFSAFLSIFASILYINPSKVYIHSDYNSQDIQDAARNGNHWTRKLLSTWPGLITWNLVRVPNYAGPNDHQRIDAIQHKSDFIRWDVVGEFGGVYLDFDVITLKSLDPLLNAGYGFVGGRQYGGKDEDGRINGTINNGVFLTKPRSAMATIMKREQHAGFTGEWASNLQTMTRTAEYLVNVPNQVLILDRTAFAPTHWFPESKNALFEPNQGLSSPEPLGTSSMDPIGIYDSVVENRRSRREWEMDFSSSYTLHAFGTGQYEHRITPKLISSRTTNYGVATYEIVKAMVAQGLIKGNEDEFGVENDQEINEQNDAPDLPLME